ncbi:MAG: DEAD/DEAH box helicase [Ardenticatenaceae bacterium]|nr:DEAD/DEAH box helicase [Ardenticatenaceae bacterium]
MHVLHLHWLTPIQPGQDGRFLLWAETNAAAQPSRDHRKKTAQPHPFISSLQELQQLLKEMGWAGKLPAEKMTLWLPTNRFGPVPSPDLLHNWETEDKPPQLMPWIVQGLGLKSIHALSLLTYLHQYDLPPTLSLGQDGRYWQTTFFFTLELLAQQRYRPTLVEVRSKRDLHYEARWQPLLDGEDEARRAAQLAAAMPAICRADADNPDETIPSRAILDSFLNHMTDAAVRQWTMRQKLYLPADQNPGAAWLRALFATEPVVQASAGQMQHFASSFRAWERTLTVAGDKQYRVALRLEAPTQQERKKTKNGEPVWQLHYLLQARDDASLLVPAAEVWKSKGSVLAALDRQFERPQERLLTGLGYAARFFPPIQRSLQRRSPSDIQLTTDEAYTFLRQCAPQLQRAGFGLLVPPWWNKPGTRLGVRLKLNSTSKLTGQTAVSTGHMNLDNLVRYQWQLSLGDTELSREEFEALVALKSPLVQIRGQWVQLDAEQIEAAIHFWQEQDMTGTLSLYEAMKLGVGGEEQQHNGLQVEGVEMDDWLQSWLKQLQGDEKLAQMSPPEGLRATLRPYQQYGYSWLHFARRWGLGVILADDMGLGKTIQTLTLIQQLKEERGQLPAPVLLICPTSVVTNWELEKRKFTPGLQTLVHQGAERLHDDALVEAAQASDVVLTSYALVRRDGATLRQINWLGVVLDEAQNIKNANTKQAQTIRQLTADFRLALTGTPVENRLSELWSIMHFLNPGFLGGQKQFRQDFTLPIEKYGDETAAQRLRKLTRPFLLRRVKTDPTVIQDLPDKQEMKVYCHLSEEQATLYEAVVQDALAAIEEQEEGGMARKGLVLSMLMQLKQVCNHPAQYLHETEAYQPGEDNGRSGKLERLDALLDEVLAEGDRMLIFSQFTEMAGLLQEYIRNRFGVPTLYLHGGVPAKKRATMVAQFQEVNGPPIFLLSLKAGGTGLNLTRANHVFHFDRWWNPAVEDQATDRAFRIGQTKNVLVHKFVCLGTLEERIDAMIEEKKALAQSVIGSGENWLTEMSTTDLRELVRLRRA